MKSSEPQNNKEESPLDLIFKLR